MIFAHCARRAFTLIELLVVISILAILLSIMLPGLNRARKLGDRVICLSNERQCATICSMYAGDNDGWLPQGNINRADDKPEYWTETNFASCLAIGKTYTVDEEIGMCQSWMKQIDQFFYKPKVSDDGFYQGGTSIGFIYFGRRYDKPGTAMSPQLAEGGVYKSPRKISDGTHQRTSATLFVCYHWDSISSNAGWGAKMPHLRGQQAKYLSPGHRQLPPIEGFAVGYLDTSAEWVPWDKLTWLEQNNTIRTYYSPRN